MKHYLTSLFIFTATLSFAQVKLSPKDLTNLIAIGEASSKGTNNGDEWLNSKRSSALNQLIDVIQEISKGEKTLLSVKYLGRPTDDELTLWYVMRGVHYNLVSKTKTPRPSLEVANEILAARTDPRFMLDYYYYKIHGGLAMLFNEADLSAENIEIEKLGFKDNTEKAIFYFNMIDGLIGGRFKVLQFLKKNDKILAFAAKLPTFNGKKYFYYTHLDFPDFVWTSYEETKSYSQVNFENLFNTISIQFISASQNGDKDLVQELTYNSILNQPKYFKYTLMKDTLQKLYNKSNP